MEDGLDCLATYDTARYDNRGHFGLKAFLAARNLIFIQNGWAKYCLDMEVNDLSVLPYPCPKYIEKPRKELTEGLDAEGKDILVRLFIEITDRIGIAEYIYILILPEIHRHIILLHLSQKLCIFHSGKHIKK